MSTATSPPESTLIAVILDRSGSMTSIRDDMEEGLNTFLADQKAQPGKCALMYVQFDTQYKAEHYENLEEAPYLTLNPRGSTALYDAVGRTIAAITAGLEGKLDPPDQVMVCIVTDGRENASKEYGAEEVKKLIEECPYNWIFTYLGANQTAMLEAGKMGISATRSMTYTASTAGISATWTSVRQSVNSLRSTGKAMIYSDEDRKRAQSS